jgi:prevent-host-death family protein
MAMQKAVTAADANRKFSQLLQEVRRGRAFLVTSHGKPVATLAPASSAGAAETGARKVLLARLRKQPVRRIGPWTRDELYEDGQ